MKNPGVRLVGIIMIFAFLFSCQKGYAQVESVEPNWETTKYGLFVHFVFGGEYGGMTPLGKTGGFPANIDEFAEKFDVQKFANDVEAMGFEYVIFTAWHANMGVLYPSKVMADYGFDQHDHYTTDRDLLAEIMDSLAVRNIKFSIYSHIFVGHDFHPAGSGYFSYDNKGGIQTQDMINSGYVAAVNGNSGKWNDFVNKVYDEMSTRYGEKVFSYWFDGTWVPDKWVDKQRMMQTISKSNKICAFVANGTPSHGLPYSSKEVGSPAGNDYGFNSDYPPVYNNDVTTWPTYVRNIALIQGGNWWASTSGRPRFSAEDVYRFTVLVAGTNTGGGVSWSFSPFVNGDWEGDMLERMIKAYSYMKPVEEAIKNTNPSTSFVTKEGTKISTLENGYIGTRSASGEFEYIHVLNNRNENFLKLPSSSDGRVYDAASLLAKDKPVDLKYNERGYVLTLPVGEVWDSLNTVIKLHLSEFVVTAKASQTRLRNPWKNQKFKIKDGSGIPVEYTFSNDSIIFSTEVSQTYVLSRSKPPKLKLGKIENNADTILLAFSEPLMVPEPITGFTFRVNNQLVDINQIVHEASVGLMVVALATPVTKDDTITVSYSGIDIVSNDGLVLDSFDNVLINNLLKGSPPRLISAISAYEGNNIEMVFNKKIDAMSIQPSSFIITDTIDDVSFDVVGVGIADNDSTRIILNLVDKVYLENQLVLNYFRNDVVSFDGGLLGEIDSFDIINESRGKAPSVVANNIINQGLGVEIVFDKTLKNIHTQKEFFRISINGQKASISSINAKNETIRFFLKNPIRYGDEVFLDFSGGVITATDDALVNEIKAIPFINNIPAPVYRSVPGKIEAENYTIQNGVATQGTSDIGGGLNVGWIDASDWMDYAIDVAEPGSYFLDLRIAAQSEGKIEVQITQGNSIISLRTITIPATGGWQSWKTENTAVNLPKGKHYLRLNVVKGGFNINWLQLTKSTIEEPEIIQASLISNARTILLTFNKTLLPVNATDTVFFNVHVDGVFFPVASISNGNSTSSLYVTLKSLVPSDVKNIYISYDGFTISSTDFGMLLPFKDFPVSLTSLIEGNRSFQDLNIYPIPAKDMLCFNVGSFQPVSAHIFDLQGKVLQEIEMQQKGQAKEIAINLQDGFYLLVFQDKNGDRFSRLFSVLN